MANDCFKFGASGVACCFAGCEFFTDNFVRSPQATTNLGSDWTEVTGDWTIDAFAVLNSPNGLAKAVVKNNNDAPGGLGNYKVVITVGTTAVGFVSNNVARIIINYIDVNNYHFSDLSLSDGVTGPDSTLSIGKKVAGVETVLRSSSFGKIGSATFSLCMNQYGIIKASIDAVSSGLGFTGSIGVNILQANVVSNTWGLGTGVMPNGGKIQYVNSEAWLNSFEDASCPTCNACPSCLLQLPPARLQAQIFGLGNGTCGSCVRREGTFILTTTAPQIHFSCDWGAATPAISPPSACTNTAGFINGNINNNILTIALAIPSPAGQANLIWAKNFGAPFDCLSLSNENIPWDHDTGSGACLGSGSTCLVTALDP